MTDTDWQPISTAPRDGTFVLVWGVRMGSDMQPRLFRSSFGGDFEGDTRPYWREVCPGFVGQIDATHWMPLPEPPQAPQTTTKVSLQSAGSNAADAAAQAERGE